MRKPEMRVKTKTGQNKASPIESEIHPSHKTPFYALCISRLHRAKGNTPDTAISSRHILWDADASAHGGEAHTYTMEGDEAYCKKLIYTNVKIDKSQRKDQLHIQSGEAGKVIRSL